MNIGKTIRLYRIQRGLSQSELANRALISVSYLSLLERNKRDPVLSTLEHICRALDIPFVLLVLAASDTTGFSKEAQEKIAYEILQSFGAQS